MSPPCKEEKIISKPRLIAALLSELEASEAVFFLKDKDTNDVFSGQMSCDFQIPFENSSLRFLHAFKSDTIDVSCCFAGKRIYFSTERISSNDWKLPTSVTISDLRGMQRSVFSNQVFSCELVWSGGAIYGYPVDINSYYLAVDTETIVTFGVSTPLSVIIRVSGTSRDLFFRECTLRSSQILDTGRTRLLISLESQQTRGERLSERTVVRDISLELESKLFSDELQTIRTNLHNISDGGMTLSLFSSMSGKKEAPLFPGSILSCKSIGIDMIVVWAEDLRLGIRPLLTNGEEVGRWIRFLERTRPSREHSHYSRQSLSSLLTESGLLKGERRKPFGKKVSDHLVNYTEESPLLVQRFLTSTTNSDSDLHVSAKRISEDAWFFGEGAALTESMGEYNSLLDNVTLRLVSMASLSPLFCRYLTGIWHHTVKSTAKWGESLRGLTHARFLNSFQLSISKRRRKAAEISGDSLKSMKISALSILSSEMRRNVGQAFEALTFDALFGHGGQHPIFTMELSKLGPYHRVDTKIITVGDAPILAAVRTKTHYIKSSTGVTNSIFVLTAKGCTEQQLLSSLDLLIDDDIAIGTDDILLILDPGITVESWSTIASSAKPFTFIVVDLLLSKQEITQQQLTQS